MSNIFSKWLNKKDKDIENEKKDAVKFEQLDIKYDNDIKRELLKEDEIDFVPPNQITNIDEVYDTLEEELSEENRIDSENDMVSYNDSKIPQLEEHVVYDNTIQKPQGIFEKLKDGLSKTRNGIKEKVDQVLSNFRKIDEELFEELEEMLIMSDISVQTVQNIIENIKKKVKLRNITDPQMIKELLKEEINEIFNNNDSELNLNTTPSVVVIVGVNGVGKTTSIGKIAHKLKSSGKKVIIAAGDTFRAAAIDQLEIWGKRVSADVIKHQESSDPGAVVFDAISAAKARNADVLICDTAGRLHNKKNLMEELGKIQRIINRELPNASKETLLVLDATTGQNAVQQAKTFSETTNLSGIILTKMDGTAKGGIIITIKSELNIPVKFIGVGEGIDDLQKFDSQNFVNALFD